MLMMFVGSVFAQRLPAFVGRRLPAPLHGYEMADCQAPQQRCCTGDGIRPPAGLCLASNHSVGAGRSQTKGVPPTFVYAPNDLSQNTQRPHATKLGTAVQIHSVYNLKSVRSVRCENRG